jgi:cytochrome c
MGPAMPNRLASLTACFAALLLTACGQPDTDEAGPAPQGEAAGTQSAAGARPAAFVQCVACHAVEPGKNGIGPTLAGVFGRPAASVPGFAYSPALKGSGLTWDEATLDRWLADPRETVPGNRMVYPGLRDPAARAELIAYMKSLS